MNKMKLLKSATLSAILYLFLSTALANETPTIDISVYNKMHRPTVMFYHDNHNDKAVLDECNMCHHVYKKGQLIPDESSEDQKCSECHSVVIKDNLTTLTTAFHKRCKGCHLQLKKGPFLCSECHVKTNRFHTSAR
jgi:hypothetical protein